MYGLFVCEDEDCVLRLLSLPSGEVHEMICLLQIFLHYRIHSSCPHLHCCLLHIHSCCSQLHRNCPHYHYCPRLRNQSPPAAPLRSTSPQLSTLSQLQQPSPILPSPISIIRQQAPTQLDHGISLTSTSCQSSSGPSIRKQCTVEGCPAQIAPSMWHNHMSLHAKGALPGGVPSEWLRDHDLHICPNCSQLVANSRHASHLRRCPQRCIAFTPLSTILPPINSQPLASQDDLPTFDQVCQLNHPTLRFVPAKARPAFARALSSALRDVIQMNSEEAWLKLFMLPKCVLPSLKRKGSHNPHTSLCNMWLRNDLANLWAMAKTRASSHNTTEEAPTHKSYRKVINSAVSLGRSGMMGKACQMLLSSGVAPNTDTTWHLLKGKHPSCPPPVAPNVTSDPTTLSPAFPILPVLRSFPKGTSAGPSGLSVQHLLDAASVSLHTSIGTSLKEVVNLLASGKVPLSVSTFLAGGRLIALNKSKEGTPQDIRPIAVGEKLRRLTGKCICAILKDRFSSFFHPLSLG